VNRSLGEKVHVLRYPYARDYFRSMKLSIAQVLQKFNEQYDEKEFLPKQYGIRFITADGRLRTMLCSKNIKPPGSGLKKPVGNAFAHLQRAGIMLVSEGAQQRSIKPATICGFKDYKSDTWQTVYH
jgi:hypothetical protein